MAPFDHTPCVVSIATDIPKSRIFRFENFWLLDDQFPGILAECWSETNQHTDCAKALTAKFKALRKRLREWQASKTGMRTIIANTRVSLQFLEVLGEYRDLSVEEWNFKELLKDHLIYLLEKLWIYWKQRDAIKWVKLGDAGTSFFFMLMLLSSIEEILSLSCCQEMGLLLVGILRRNIFCGRILSPDLGILNLMGFVLTLIFLFRGWTISTI